MGELFLLFYLNFFKKIKENNNPISIAKISIIFLIYSLENSLVKFYQFYL